MIKKILIILSTCMGLINVVSLCVVYHSKAHTPDPPSASAVSAFTEAPVMTGFEFTRYSNGKKVFVVTAGSVYLRNRVIPFLGLESSLMKDTQLEDVEVVFYKDNVSVSTLHSRVALLDMRRKNMVFEGMPGLISPKRGILSAEKISWDDAKQQLLAEGDCALATPTKEFTAQRITTDPQLAQFSVF